MRDERIKRLADWSKIDFEAICPICQAQKQGKVFCRSCTYWLKPMGGHDNDPDSLCTQEKKMNYVAGETEYHLCKEKNDLGECPDFKKKSDERVFGEEKE